MSDDGIPEMHKLYGLVAEFSSAESLVAAARHTLAAGYRRVDAFAPFPVDELAAALGLPPSHIPLVMLGGGFTGAAIGLGMQYYATFVTFPMNIGGRPLNAWPGFILPTVELIIFCAVLSGLIGLFLTLRLPAVYHPVFNHPDFRRSSRDGFFLCIEGADPHFDGQRTVTFLHTLAPLSVEHVEK